MKYVAGAFLAAACLLVMLPTEASAWTCRATSPSAWGVATYPDLGYAKRRALVQCSVRTPRYQTCYIRWCR